MFWDFAVYRRKVSSRVWNTNFGCSPNRQSGNLNGLSGWDEFQSSKHGVERRS